MHKETLQKAAQNAVIKDQMIQNAPLRALVYSIMAGFFVGLAMYFSHAVSAGFFEYKMPSTKLVMGLSFPIALLLVLFAGADLFTGNVMYCSSALWRKEMKPVSAFRVCIFAFVGNWLGGLLICAIIYLCGFLDPESATFLNILNTASIKMSGTALQLFFRGVMGNVMVCLAIFMSIRTKENTAKILLIFFAIFTFVSSGYEHSIANMGLLSMAVVGKNQMIDDLYTLQNAKQLISGLDFVNLFHYFRNILFTGLGNFAGGVLVACAYSFVSGEKERN